MISISGAAATDRHICHYLFRDVFGTIGHEASPQHALLVNAFVSRLDGILPWDRAAVDATTRIKVTLNQLGIPISPNDATIAGHAVATRSILVTNHVKAFSRVEGLVFEEWS